MGRARTARKPSRSRTLSGWPVLPGSPQPSVGSATKDALDVLRGAREELAELQARLTATGRDEPTRRR